METLKSMFNVNGLLFWNEKQIILRKHMVEIFSHEIKKILLKENLGWQFHRVEGSLLTPINKISGEYTSDDVWVQEVKGTEEQLVLRPETTPSSYVYAENLLRGHYNVKPPFVVWQVGKSFRREQDQVTKNMRLKEFYQQEFQCIYASDTMNDYQTAVLEPIKNMFEMTIGAKSHYVESDRQPSYSKKTMDIEVFDGEKNMEVCSISIRKDFPSSAKIQTKKGIIEKELDVLEIAIGLDRCIYLKEKADTMKLSLLQ